MVGVDFGFVRDDDARRPAKVVDVYSVELLKRRAHEGVAEPVEDGRHVDHERVRRHGLGVHPGSPALVVLVDGQRKPVEQPLPWLLGCSDDEIRDFVQLVLMGPQRHPNSILAVRNEAGSLALGSHEVIDGNLGLQRTKGEEWAEEGVVFDTLRGNFHRKEFGRFAYRLGQRAVANRALQSGHIRLVLIIHRETRELGAQLLEGADERITDTLVLGEPRHRLSQKVGADARVFLWIAEEMLYQRARVSGLFHTKHLRHGHGEDGVAHAQASRFLEDHVSRLCRICAPQTSECPHQPLEASQQVLERLSITGVRRCFENGLLQDFQRHQNGQFGLLQL